MSGNRPFDRERQKGAVSHIVASFPEGLSVRRLRHLLYLSDMEAYRHLGASITGAGYTRGRKAPRVQGLRKTLRQLQVEGVIRGASKRR